MAWKPDYATVAEVKATIGIDAGDTGDDAVLAVYVTAASRAVDTGTRRQFGLLAAPAAWTYTAEYRRERGVWVIPVDDYQTLTGAELEFDGAPLATWTPWPRDAVDKGQAWTHIVVHRDDAGALDCTEDGVTATVRWGWTTVPVTVGGASRLQASRFFARRESPYGVAGSPELGSELRLLAKLDADVAVMLAAYHRDAVPL